MAHESFEDEDIAGILNRAFVAIKVDREERPDIDSTYMSVCQALTGGGGWPMSIFMTPEQKPFYAGTYFPKTTRRGMIGFSQLLLAIEEKWRTERPTLLRSAEQIVEHFQPRAPMESGKADESLIDTAAALFRQSFDSAYGGFGAAPKFPTPHNLLFLLDAYQRSGDAQMLEMAEATLRQMYRGGLFDHIGYGFSRYSTDRFYLVPHFEKMLYDNALLIMAYAKAYEVTKKPLYREVAEKTAEYVLRELTGPEGEFYCAQDADSDGVEGKYYLFTPEEVIRVLGEEAGAQFNLLYDITPQGNFEGKNIPNLLKSEGEENVFTDLDRLRAYRRERTQLHLDDKVLTAWNGLMIAALARLYRATGNEANLRAAERAEEFLTAHLCRGDSVLVSFRNGRQGGPGFLDDYAFYIFALLELYGAAMAPHSLEKAKGLAETVIQNFSDESGGGFTLSGKKNERLIFAPKDTYDGAIPSGNSVMAHNLVRLYALTGEDRYGGLAERQLAALAPAAGQYPAGCCFYLLALSRWLYPPRHTTAVLKNGADRELLRGRFGPDENLTVLEEPTRAYPLLHDETTFYVCAGGSCRPPTNELPE